MPRPSSQAQQLRIAKRLRGDDQRLRIVPARLVHVPIIDRLRRLDAASLGFLSRGAIEEKIALGHVWLAMEGRRPIGCLIHGSLRRPEVRIFLLMVDPMYRGRGIARALLQDLKRRSISGGAFGLSLRCREKLPANGFWHRAGFALHDVEAGRQGALYVWVQPTVKTREALPPFRFHSRWHQCPRCGQMTCDTWVAGARRYRTCVQCTLQRTQV
jgi:GNAT superfamily N-acetyltransferase